MKQHKADWTSLIFGTAFLAIAGLALAERTLDLQINGLEWLLPLLAALIGVGLLAGGRSKRGLAHTVKEKTTESGDSID